MGTCVSRCYPTSTVGSGSPSSCSSPPAPEASCNVVAVHPHPLPCPSSPSTSSSSKAMAATSSSSSSFNAMAATSSSSSSFNAMAATSSSSSSFNAMATSSSSSSSSTFVNRLERDSLLEWDVVVLDPNKKKPPMRPHPSKRRPATSKRARSLSPLATRPVPSTHHKKKMPVVRSTEPHSDAQVRKMNRKVTALDLEQRGLTPHSRGAPEDELSNPLISMDCFIFL